MIPNDQPLRRQTLERMLDHLSKRVMVEDEVYTAWEVEFIDSVCYQFLDKGDLSNKQCEIVERLYNK